MLPFYSKFVITYYNTFTKGVWNNRAGVERLAYRLHSPVYITVYGDLWMFISLNVPYLSVSGLG